MANEITYSPNLTTSNGPFRKTVGSQAIRADQVTPGASAQSGQASPAPVPVTIIDDMTTPGIALIGNSSERDSGDDNLILRTVTGGIIFMFVKPGESYVFRVDPSAVDTTFEILSDGSASGTCMYSLDIFED